MKPSEVFGVILKSIGVLVWVIALAQIPNAINLARFYPTEAEGGLSMVLNTFGLPGILFISGCWLVFFTEWFVRLGYPPPPVRDDDSPPESLS